MDEQKPETKKFDPFDLDGDGVPDYRQSWFWRAIWNGVKLVAAIVPQHTDFARAVNTINQRIGQ